MALQLLIRMYNKSLLLPEIQEFIAKNLNNDLSIIALKKNPFQFIDFIEVLEQIQSKSKSMDKLNTWYKTKGILFPKKIAIEQTSSEQTALYKSNLVNGNRLIDLTGGFGVDCFYFSKKIKEVFHCEINEELSQIVAHNFNCLNVSNVKCINDDSFNVLTNLDLKYDWIYVDPSRRSDVKGKVFLLKDCLPDVSTNLEFYFNYTNNILIKTAPILDLTAGIKELDNVKEIHIIAINNEVKEILWVLQKGYNSVIIVRTINITKGTNEIFEYKLGNESYADFSLTKDYLYEPNAAIMKSGGFNEICIAYNLKKLSQHSHLYTNKEKIDFPGRVFKVLKNIPYSKKEIKENLENIKANITTRNFPETVEYIRKKWKIKDGGDLYCFFTTDINNNKIVLLCQKLN